MSIASELSALNGHIISAYDEINTMGGTVPQNKNMANLPTAIASIPSGGGGSATIGTYNVISGTATVQSDTTTISVLSYNDFMTAVGGTMPAKVGLGVFDADVVYNMPAGFAYKFGFKGANSTPLSKSQNQVAFPHMLIIRADSKLEELTSGLFCGSDFALNLVQIEQLSARGRGQNLAHSHLNWSALEDKPLSLIIINPSD